MAVESREREDSVVVSKGKQIHISTRSSSTSGEEKEADATDDILSSEETLARARLDPTSTNPLYVKFACGDPSNPHNWSLWRKWYIHILANILNITTIFIANGYSMAASEVEIEFNTSPVLTALGFTLHLWGFSIGSVILAPLSEYYGRFPVYITSWFFLIVFQIPAALAPNMQTLLFCKLVHGLAGSAPVANTGGVLGDLFTREESGPPAMLYSLGMIFGHAIVMVPSGWIVEALGWRWLFWIFAIISGMLWTATLFTLPETRHSIILERKAEFVRQILASEGHASAPILSHIHDAHSKGAKRTLCQLFSTYMLHPFRFLATEPIVIAAAAYNAVVYGIFFIFNEAFPFVFSGNYGFSIGFQGMSFLGLAVGALVAACFHPFQERYYRSRTASNHGQCVPEARMHQARFGAFLIPASLFWFAWTSSPSLAPWIVPIVATLFYGAGLYTIVLSLTSYVLDTYPTYGASALAAVNLGRGIVGGCFPLFSYQLYEFLGSQWATTLLAFLTLIFVPVPIWWFYAGQRLRARSRWAQ